MRLCHARPKLSRVDDLFQIHTPADVRRQNASRAPTDRVRGAPKCVPLNGLPKLYAYRASNRLSAEARMLADRRPRFQNGTSAMIDAIVRGATRPRSKSTISDPGRSPSSASSSSATPSGVPLSYRIVAETDAPDRADVQLAPPPATTS